MGWSGYDDAKLVEVLRACVALPNAERFAYLDAVPRRASESIDAFYRLIDLGFLERIPVACGVWFYRVTPAGKIVAITGVVPRREDDGPGLGSSHAGRQHPPDADRKRKRAEGEP